MTDRTIPCATIHTFGNISMSIRRCCIGFALLLASITAIASSGKPNADRTLDILGWIEAVELAPGGLVIEAKLDTGADNSSLNAPDYEEFKKDGDTWVRFTVTNSDDEAATFEKPLHRTARIRSASGTDRRPVVKMEICLGGVVREAQVNLADRSDLSYQMLIGRSFMKDHILVDSGNKHVGEPVCERD